jgi:two-component system cell cycle sensor histidine kinase/response regulator CckA
MAEAATRTAVDGDRRRRPRDPLLTPLFYQAPVAMALVDAGGRMVDANARLLALTGGDRAGLVGRAFAELFRKEDRDDVQGRLSRLAIGGARAGQAEGLRLAAAADGGRSFTLHARRIDAGGDGAAVVVHLLAEAAGRPPPAQRLHAEKIQALGQLAGGIAHDFNNLLTAMAGFCELLADRHRPGDPSHDDIQQIRRTADRAAGLVRQLLAFSRKQALKPMALDAHAALCQLSAMLARVLGETVRLELDLGSARPRIRIDPGQFDQMILNLAVNARDAMGGGGRLVIRTSDADPETPIDCLPEPIDPGSYVVIEVSDSGHGIPKEILATIFEPFFTTKEEGAGLGLGLATVYGIVRQSGGSIAVDSAPGEGASFRLYLPAESEPALTEPAGEPPPPAEAQGQPTVARTVLVVEDEDAVRAIVVRALKGRGYRVVEAADGEEAFDRIGEAGPGIDLVLSDVVMPGMDGCTLVRLLRQELPRVPAILMSGYADEGLGPDLSGDSATSYLAKPFSLAALAAKVEEAFSA